MKLILSLPDGKKSRQANQPNHSVGNTPNINILIFQSDHKVFILFPLNYNDRFTNGEVSIQTNHLTVMYSGGLNNVP